MKILLITSKYLPHIGGLENVVYHLAKELKKHHEVRIITNRYPRQLPKKEIIGSVEVDRLFFFSLLFKGKTLLQFIKYLVGFFIIPFSIISLYKKINSFKPDVINYHFVSYTALYVLLINKMFPECRLIVSVHGEDIETFPYESKYNMWLLKNILKKADYVTACSDYIFSKGIKIVPEIRNKSIAIGNGVDLKDFKVKVIYNYSKPYILSMGRFVQKKGIDILIKAFKKIAGLHQDIHLLIAGDGPEKDNLKSLIDHLGLADKVKLTGIIKGAEKTQLLMGCMFFVLPSRREPFGIVILEAMAAGKTVVAMDTGGVPEIIEDGVTCLLVKKEDPDSLADGILQMLKEKGLKERLANNGQNLVKEKYTWEKITKKYLSVYKGGFNG